jgi:hypothetical protein
MAKPLRSPLLGYNHNLTHLGHVFHVQSEDSGPGTPRVFTHLFFEGTILVSRKQEYDASLPDDKVRGLMQAQHKTVMKDLMQARLNEMIIAFFAARGEDLVPVPRQGVLPETTQGAVPVAMQGALPEAPLEVSGPVMVLPDVPGVATAQPGIEASASAVDDRDPRGDTDERERIPAPVSPRRTATRSFEPLHRRGKTPTPVVVRPPEARRSPFVRSGAPAVATMSSTDGVVVQRNVVVGGSSAPSARPARIRPPVPYVVTGGGHTERLPHPAPGSSVTQPMASPVLTAAPSPPPKPAPVSAVEAPRLTGGFGLGLAEDKSLDEVILEYLAEDGDSG